MTISIRNSVPADAEAIAKIQVETWWATYTGIVSQAYLDALNIQERTQSWLDQIQHGDTDIFVAHNDGLLCGFINSGPIRDTVNIADLGYDAEIHTLYVSPQTQGIGIGRRLMQAAAQRLLDRRLLRPVVWGLTQNPYCRFYERLGGRVIAEKTIHIGGEPLPDTAYGWDHTNDLLSATT